jgi:hypothetical protein
MAEITTFKIANAVRAMREEGKVVLVEKSFSLAAGNNADTITIAELAAGERVVGAFLDVSGTLGASCTLQARASGTAITSATTAGGASVVHMDKYPPAAAAAGDKLDILIGGANVAATATVKVAFLVIRN